MTNKRVSKGPFNATKRAQVLAAWEKDGFATFPVSRLTEYQPILDDHWRDVFKRRNRPVVRVKTKKANAIVEVVDHLGRTPAIDQALGDLVADPRISEPSPLLYKMPIEMASNVATMLVAILSRSEITDQRSLPR